MGRWGWLSVVFLPVGIGVIAAPARAQSFDCHRAFFADEQAICRSAQLSKLDDDLAVLFGRAIKASAAAQRAELTRQETQWVVSRRHCAHDDACLEQSYRARIAALSNRVRGAEDFGNDQLGGHPWQAQRPAATADVAASSPRATGPEKAASDQNSAPQVTVQFR